MLGDFVFLLLVNMANLFLSTLVSVPISVFNSSISSALNSLLSGFLP